MTKKHQILWHYLVNQFLNATKRNFKKALRLSNYHDAVLKMQMEKHPEDPDWAFLYNRYHSLHLAFCRLYAEWKQSGGKQEGMTLDIDQLLVLLITKVARWDALVQVEYAKNTPDYKILFPDGHSPFNSGGKDSKIIAVETLGKTLADYPTLSAVKTEVDDFYNTLDESRDDQQGTKGEKKGLGAEVELSRRQIMIMQYGNMAFLINKYMNAPMKVVEYFDLPVLTDHQQVLFTGTLDPQENEAVMIHTFVADDEIRIKVNKGEVKLYLATAPNGTNSTPVEVNAIEPKIITASAFGITEYGTHRYLTIINNSSEEIDYEIKLI